MDNNFPSMVDSNTWQPTEWCEQIITVTANLIRDSREFNNIKFFLQPSDYVKFMKLTGTYKGHCVDSDADIIFEFSSNDILIILSDNVLEVIDEYEEKKEKDKEILDCITSEVDLREIWEHTK